MICGCFLPLEFHLPFHSRDGFLGYAEGFGSAITLFYFFFYCLCFGDIAKKLLTRPTERWCHTYVQSAQVNQLIAERIEWKLPGSREGNRAVHFRFARQISSRDPVPALTSWHYALKHLLEGQSYY